LGNEFVKAVSAVVREFAPVPAVVLVVGAITFEVPPVRWES